MAAPLHIRFPSIIHALLTHANLKPKQIFIRFINQNSVASEAYSWTFSETLYHAEVSASALSQCRLKTGDRIVIFGGNDPATISFLLGSLGSGIIPAIVHSPIRARSTMAREYLHSLQKKMKPSLVIAPPDIWPTLRKQRKIKYMSASELLNCAKGPQSLTPPKYNNNLAYLQFSSGTTEQPKAIMLSALCQVSNAHATGKQIQVQENEKWVVWLPIYHDMGLMAGVLIPLYYGHEVILLTPENFVRHPLSWMQAIHTYKGTLTVAPNFAYALAERRARASKSRLNLDLSSLRVAFNGAEMIRASTVQNFEKLFALYGLKTNTVYPVYGLAEFTLSAVFAENNQPIRIDRVSRLDLAQGQAKKVSANTANCIDLVSVGKPIIGHSMRVVDTKRQLCTERQIGEIQLQGPSQMLGYYRDKHLSMRAMSDNWLKTGDLGYIANGQLYICGRKKEMIIRFGENFYPNELEHMCLSCSLIKPGRLAVFGLIDKQLATERVWLVVESEHIATHGQEQNDNAYRMAQSIRREILRDHGFKFDGVGIVPHGFIRKTSSGKIQRYQCRIDLIRLFNSNQPPPFIGQWPESTE